MTTDCTVGEQLRALLDVRYVPKRGTLHADVARTIDERPAEPLRAEDGDWGEHDSLENVPRDSYSVERELRASENPNKIGPVQEDPGWPVRFEQFQEFGRALAKRYPTEKLAAVNASAFDRGLVPLPTMPWWRRLRGALRWWWISARSLVRRSA